MSGPQLNGYLVVLLVTVSVQYSYGGEKPRLVCTTTSECDFDNGYCFQNDQCDMGECICKRGYFYDQDRDTKCWKIKKIGESCDDATDVCGYNDGHCENKVCKCSYNNKPASKDGLFCGSRFYDESCYTDVDCRQTMKCLSKKCNCASGHKQYTKTGPFGLTETVCVKNDAKVDVKANGLCDYTNNFCTSGLTCNRCPGPNEELRCMSGASQLSISVLAFGGLLATVMLTTFY